MHNLSRPLLKVGFLVAIMTLAFTFYSRSDKSTNPAKEVSAPTVWEATDLAIATKFDSADPSPIELIHNTTDLLAEGEPIESESTGIEFADAVDLTDELSVDQEIVDFKMMNPGVPDNGATEGTVEYEVMTRPVDWDAARDHPKLPQDLLSKKQTDVVDLSVIPVLLPPHQNLLDDGVLSIGDTWYAASMDEGGVNVLIEGSSASVILPNDGESNYGTLDSYQITRSFGMVEVRVSVFSVGYTITVECFDHENDPACTYDDYMAGIVDNLLLVNGDKKDEGA